MQDILGQNYSKFHFITELFFTFLGIKTVLSKLDAKEKWDYFFKVKSSEKYMRKLVKLTVVITGNWNI